MSTKKATVKNAPGKHYPASWVVSQQGLPSAEAYKAAWQVIDEWVAKHPEWAAEWGGKHPEWVAKHPEWAAKYPATAPLVPQVPANGGRNE